MRITLIDNRSLSSAVVLAVLVGCGQSASPTAGSHPTAGSSASGGAPDSGAGTSKSDSNITGTLGALGSVQPIMAGFATTNGLETLIYLSTAPLTCAMMMTRGAKWLSTLPPKSQVIEIVIGTPAAAKTYPIGTPASLGGGEVNYAEGSKSSSTEVVGSSGSIIVTTATAMGVHEGTVKVTAPYTVSGNFHAEWCQGGSEY